MILAAALLAGIAATAPAQDAPPPTATAARFYAVEFRTGPRWDAAKAPSEQARFQEHSQNLKRLRQEGRILLGGRYSDRGFLVLAGESDREVRRLFEEDPSVVDQVFVFDVWEFRPFYAGCVGAKAP